MCVVERGGRGGYCRRKRRRKVESEMWRRKVEEMGREGRDEKKRGCASCCLALSLPDPGIRLLPFQLCVCVCACVLGKSGREKERGEGRRGNEEKGGRDRGEERRDWERGRERGGKKGRKQERD